MSAEPTRMDRRMAIKWMLTAAASAPLFQARAFGAEGKTTLASRGYGTDPDLTKTYAPGELWPLTLTPAGRRTVTALADLILPADAKSPAASAVGVTDFLDEWISAPYPRHERDRKTILEGLEWLEREAAQRFSRPFADLEMAQQAAIADVICYEPKARAEHKDAAAFFARFRDLASGGYYTSLEGTKDLRYVGNLPSVSFAGPPPEVLRHVGLL